MSAWSGSLPPPGEESSEFIEEKGVLLRHGSSLALMALVSTALNESDEFGEVDPEDDWKTVSYTHLTLPTILLV